MSYGSSSYTAWAQYIESIIGKRVSKQAIFERMNSSWVLFVKQLLEMVLVQHISKVDTKEIFNHFNRVLLQDSTNIHLPDYMARIYKGGFAKGKEKSIAKLNLVIDIFSGKFLLMQCMSFTKTEQAIASNILDLSKKGDLVIRDLGYSSLGIFEQMTQKGIYFLSRLQYGISLFEAESQRPINLLQPIIRIHQTPIWSLQIVIWALQIIIWTL